MDLIRLTKRNKDGAFGTQKNRQRGLTAMAAELKSMGFVLKSAKSIKPKHVDALVSNWRDKGLTNATIRNRMSWLRWWADKVDKVPVLHRSNAAYELLEDKNGDTNNAFSLTAGQLDKLSDKYVKATVLLQAAFGLRREEALKIIPSEAIKTDCIKLKGSWTKGGRPRTVPITSYHQRTIAGAVSQIAGLGSLIPEGRTYAQHLGLYERQTAKAGIYRPHGLRHQYAQTRYEKMTGMKCPLNGGPSKNMMAEGQYELDRQARAQIAKELGHSRVEVCDIYLGRLLNESLAA